MMDTYNGEWKTPAFTAMCLWEEVITSDCGTYPELEIFREDHGSCAARDQILGLVEHCDEAWLWAAANGWDGGAFDWDFVPQYLALWTADRTATAETIGMTILNTWKATRNDAASA